MGIPTLITYINKTNLNAIVDRTKQSTAEDWQDVKDVVNNLARLLHRESDDVALSVATSHEISFDDNFDDTDYCIVKMVVYKEITGGIDDVGYFNLVKSVDKINFETYTDVNLKIDYFITLRG